MTEGLKCCVNFGLNVPCVELQLGTRFILRVKEKNAAVTKEKAAPQEVHRRVTSAIKEMQLHSRAPVRCCY